MMGLYIDIDTEREKTEQKKTESIDLITAFVSDTLTIGSIMI